MAMVLDGMSTLHDTHPSAHPSLSSSVSVLVDIFTLEDSRIADTRGDLSSSSSPSGLTSNLVHGG
ncbi:hypothetical protein N7537_007696 [Penicillium hordei]|uniref:Uncharacterized protein n=1 Tax=Penicillium hordei TaxID=40994 RepID=A0AAD6DZ10_9EURO|nr:uncharacterized protein N7537_007696 [Penicillium hordei]KAJ5597612.1 hypothetical protein N7537_007696 [Penicillium hordei]